VIKIEKAEYRRANLTGSIRPVKRVRCKDLSVDRFHTQRSPGHLGKRPDNEKPDFESEKIKYNGFEKIEPKVNHRYMFYLLGLIEKDLKKDHYTTGQEDLTLYDFNGLLIGGF